MYISGDGDDDDDDDDDNDDDNNLALGVWNSLA